MKLLSKGRRALLPISNFFHGAIPEEDLDFQFDTHSRILNPYAAWDLMRKHLVVKTIIFHKRVLLNKFIIKSFLVEYESCNITFLKA